MIIFLRFNLHSNFRDFADSADFDAQSSHDHLLARLYSLLSRFLKIYTFHDVCYSDVEHLFSFTDEFVDSWTAVVVAVMVAIEAA